MTSLKRNKIIATLLTSSLLTACGGGGGGSSSNTSTSVSTPAPVTQPAPTPEPAAIVRPETPEAAPAGPDFHPADKGWTLSWSDEFDGDAVDLTKWSLEHACWGGGNNEKQCYTDREDNVEIVNGLLRIVALEETFTGPDNPGDTNLRTQPYTSGKLITQDIADWTYGRFEFRAKLPEGQGSWPAFWMLGATDTYTNTWPLIGEIDVMEAVNLGARCDECEGTDGENRTSNAIHYGSPYPNNQHVSSRTMLADISNPADGYHVWAVEWGEGVIQWFLDGELYSTIRNDQWYTDAAPDNPNAPFDAAFYIIINLAIGGNFPEPLNAGGIADETLPNQLLVDWVRVYQCEEDMEKGLACMTSDATEE